MSTRISTRHLQMVEAIAQAGSVSEAAKRIGVSQSALSHRLREVERLLGTAMFTRHNKKLRPTSAGDRLLQSAQMILGELERAETDIVKLSVGIEHVIRLGHQEYCNIQALVHCLNDHIEANPDQSVEILTETDRDPYTALRHGQIDICVVSGGISDPSVHALPMLCDEMVVVMASDHPLAGRAWLNPEEIAAWPYVAYHTNPQAGREYDSLFRCHQVLPPRVFRAGVTEAVIEFVRAGAGLTILPRWTLEPYLEQGGLAVSKATEEGLPINWHVILRGNESEDSPTFTLAKNIIHQISRFSPAPLSGEAE